jgi:O-antigen ligase
MLSEEIEKRLTTILTWGCLIVTLLVTDRVTADPVNVSKMLALATTAGFCVAILIIARTQLLLNLKFIITLLAGFLLMALISIIVSGSPWEKGFFGTYGRNTGFLTYLSLSVVFLAGTLLMRGENYIRIIRSLILAGFLNLVYCIYAIYVKDLFTWQNPYGKVLGTFGNPNFISSFMGIFITALFSVLFMSGIKLAYRVSIVVLIFASFFVIASSGSQQGGVVAIGGIATVVFFLLRARFKSRIAVVSYLTVVSISGLIAVLGMLQRGPLVEVLYKQSVSLRGEYWQAGINMGLSNPVFGVGLDSYGTFYRAYRNETATVVPGINTITDAAHNIFLDIFASTGFPGISLYLAIIFYIFSKSLLYVKKSTQFDPIFVLLFSCWLAYQAQAVISINQIGIAVWGWIFGGLLMGYTRKAKLEQSNLVVPTFPDLLKLKKRATNSEIPASLVLGIFFGGLLFFGAAIPSFYADAKLRQALGSGSFEKLFAVANQFPLDSNRINFVASKISEKGIDQQSVDIIRIGLEKFPYDYGLLFSQFRISVPDSAEQRAIGKRLHSADPYNPAYFNFK